MEDRLGGLAVLHEDFEQVRFQGFLQDTQFQLLIVLFGDEVKQLR